MRTILKRFGSHGRSVRVVRETFADRRRHPLIRVEWRELGKRRTESLPDSRENVARARAFAEGVAHRLALVKGAPAPGDMTMEALGERYLAAHPTPDVWRAKSRAGFLARWKVWLTFATRERPIDTVTPDLLDDFREAMRAQDYAINQVANTVQLVRSVYRFARTRGYLRENPIADYRMRLSRDARRLHVPEWTPEECGRILAQYSVRHPGRWRACCAIVLDAVLGGRSNALLHLEWSDIDLTARTLRWRPALDKFGKDRVQPLPRDAVYVLRVLRVWRARIGYTGPYVFPGDARRAKRTAAERRDRPYSYQALNQSLHHAADRAGVAWVDYRAMHGFRRMVLNNVRALTGGDLVLAGQWIGDTDMGTLSQSYVRERSEELRGVAAALPSIMPKRGGGGE